MDRITRKILDCLTAINQIPRCSKNETLIADWLINWAKDQNLKAETDTPGNLCIKVPATAGYESNAGVIIQGHMDMVCEKTPESKHDFTKDAVPLVHRGDWITATDTTLGADNGIALAMAMVLVEELPSPHPPSRTSIYSG